MFSSRYRDKEEKSNGLLINYPDYGPKDTLGAATALVVNFSRG